MKYLVDANLLSEPTKPQPVAAVVDWLRKNETSLAVNPIILGELEFGILMLPPGRRTRLLKWFSRATQNIRVLEFDATLASTWARLLADLKRKGRQMPIKNSLIAATARHHQLTVATRNITDYKHAAVPLVNPFQNKGRTSR